VVKAKTLTFTQATRYTKMRKGADSKCSTSTKQAQKDANLKSKATNDRIGLREVVMFESDLSASS